MDPVYDYYVEFRVKVGNIGASNLKEILENTAVWDARYETGGAPSAIQVNVSDDFTSYTMSVVNDDSIGSGDSDVPITKIADDFADGFDASNYGILTKKNADGTISGRWLIPISKDVRYISVESSGITEAYNIYGTSDADEEILKKVNAMTEEEVANAYQATEILTSADLTLKEYESLTLFWNGSVSAELDKDSALTNKGTIQFKVNDVENSVSTFDVKKQSNTVETDVIWLYLDVQKEIALDDAEQSFLVQVDYYPKGATEATETFYTRINCTDAVTDASGTTTGYLGDQLLQCGKRGTYVITELTDWSDTDYSFGSATWQENADATKTSVTGNQVTLTLPETTNTKTGAIPTAVGTDPLTYAPIVTFRNEKSIYAFLSSQAYAENNFSLPEVSGGDAS
jgi:hypothetical protein